MITIFLETIIHSFLKGLDQGLVGMKKNSRRFMVVPANLAWGSQGNETVPANSTILYDVSLLYLPCSCYGCALQYILYINVSHS